MKIDDCWLEQDPQTHDGQPRTRPREVPGRIKAAADYVHSLGLKFGIYRTRHDTCGGFPGCLGHEQPDATFASWGVDYLKYDNCYNQGQRGGHAADPTAPLHGDGRRPEGNRATDRVQHVQWGTDATVCHGPWGQPVQPVATTSDISDNFASMRSRIVARTRCSPVRGPGAWNDPDMLESATAA